MLISCISAHHSYRSLVLLLFVHIRNNLPNLHFQWYFWGTTFHLAPPCQLVSLLRWYLARTKARQSSLAFWALLFKYYLDGSLQRMIWIHPPFSRQSFSLNYFIVHTAYLKQVVEPLFRYKTCNPQPKLLRHCSLSLNVCVEGWEANRRGFFPPKYIFK